MRGPLQLYANVRPVKSFPNVPSLLKDVKYGDIDWVRFAPRALLAHIPVSFEADLHVKNELDSFILDREHLGRSTAESPAPPATDENPREGWPYIERGGRKARENWPYPQYDHNDGSSTTNLRTWARGGTTLGGFGFP